MQEKENKRLEEAEMKEQKRKKRKEMKEKSKGRRLRSWSRRVCNE